jgi:hypothetical protein
LRTSDRESQYRFLAIGGHQRAVIGHHVAAAMGNCAGAVATNRRCGTADVWDVTAEIFEPLIAAFELGHLVADAGCSVSSDGTGRSSRHPNRSDQGSATHCV